MAATGCGLEAGGIASAPVPGCTRLYDQLGFHLLHGSFPTGSGLGRFYQVRGFERVPPGGGVSREPILGVRAVLGTEPHEQLFARWRY